MPARRPVIALDEVAPYIRRRCFTPRGTELIGAELEWITADVSDLSRHPSLDRLRAIGSRVRPLPRGSSLTMEPGGQLELSSKPALDIGSVTDALAVDAQVLSAAAAEAGIVLMGTGLHPNRDCRRLLDTDRYSAMEAYYERVGEAGRRMMCNTAAIQVNLDLGTADRMASRWSLAHVLGPVLGAVFANSPLSDGRTTGWRSTRLANWWDVDPTRTLPVGVDGDPVEEWTTYALDAHVMLIRVDGSALPLRAPLSFRRWIEDGHELGHPTWEDLDYHLTTLFPPVRPREWLELRMIDALPGSMWRVAVAVTAALFYDEAAAGEAAEVSLPAADRWADAFRFGLQHPVFGLAGDACMRLAIEALGRGGAPGELVAEVTSFYHRYTERGLTPADEALGAWISGREPWGVDDRSEAAWI